MITILCSGSRGDLQPYIALAQELKAQNKEVRIVGGISFKGFVEGYGIDYVPLSMDQESTEIDPKLLEAAKSSSNPLKMLLTFNKMKKYARLMVDEMYEACVESDLIIYHPGCTIGYFAAKQLGIPSILATPFPMLKTKEVPSVIAYGKTKMPITLSYKMLQGMLWMASKTGVELFWKERFHSLPPQFGIPFERVDEQHPSLVSCSNWVFKRPTDWNPHIHQYDYWFVKEEKEYTAPKEVVEFLSKGSKPIYFGFGSVFNQKEKEYFINIITKALKETNNRGILCGFGPIDSLDESIISIGSISHTWLFPQCAAVCHHGGAGTSAAGFAAGVPSIIIPFSNDQFAWAHRSYDLGVGSKPIYKKKLSTSTLVSAIKESTSPLLLENARILGEHIALEQGVEDTCKVILDLLEKE